MRNTKFALIILAVIYLIGCKSSKDASLNNPDAIFNEAMELYNDEDYLDAEQKFDVFKLQYPASDKADDAQFYLAKIKFFTKEYILSAFNFNRLRSIYPGSEFVKESLYMEGECYFKESPNYERDQDYTKKAISAFQEYQYLYPEADSLYKMASERINELRNKLAHKDYAIAVLYTKLDDPRAAVIYFDSVIRNFDDTEYFEPAVFGKIESLHTMKKREELKNVIRYYKNKFPDGENLNSVKDIEKSVY